MAPSDKIPSQQLFRHWQHSFEEDRGDVQVYRPADYEFPPARGRDGIEFRPDGTAVRYAIGRGDAPSPQPAQWHITGPNQLQFQSQGSSRDETIEIMRVNDEVLEVRRS